MANLTVFQGRQCTRVRRAVNGNQAQPQTQRAGNGASAPAATPLPATPRASSPPVNGASTVVANTPGVATVPNIPGISGQATVVIPLPLVQLPPVTSAPRPPQAVSTPGPASLVPQSMQPSPLPIPVASPVAPPPAVSTSAVPKAPQPVPPNGPQQPPNSQATQSAAQQEPARSQSQVQAAQPSGPFASIRPITQLPLSQPQIATATPEVSQPRGGTNGGNTLEGASPVAQSTANANNGRPTQAPPAQQSSQTGQLVPPLSQAQGTEAKQPPNARQTLVPTLVTSNGVTRTTLVLPSSTAKGRNTDGIRSSTRSLSSALSTRTPGTGAGANNGAGLRTSKGNSVPIIAGVVSAFVVIVALCAIIFFRARRKRNVPDEMASRYRRSSTGNDRNMRGFWNGRFSRGNSVTDQPSERGMPAPERGMSRLPYMAEVEPYRRRSLSEPATTRSVQQPSQSVQQVISPTAGTFDRTPSVSTNSPSSHRRSVSSFAGLAYPVLSETNNPFMDPEPSAQLRIVNPDCARSGSAASINPPTPSQAAINDARLSRTSPKVPSSASSSSPRSAHQRSQSILKDPFRDVETILEDPFADPIPAPLTHLPARSSRMNHQRNQSSSASSGSHYSERPSNENDDALRQLIAGMPIIAEIAPTSTASSHRYQASVDSGMLMSNASPAPVQATRFEGLGISDTLPTTTAAPNSVPAPIVSGLLPPPSPSFARRVSHNRLSSTSSASDLSLSFPASWGSPGPTRPASVATQGGPSLAAALAVANGNSTVQKPRDSRASDPFDLDDPTLLSYPGSEAGGYRISTLTRNDTQRKPDRANS